jgi:hypothetical protein
MPSDIGAGARSTMIGAERPSPQATRRAIEPSLQSVSTRTSLGERRALKFTLTRVKPG